MMRKSFSLYAVVALAAVSMSICRGRCRAWCRQARFLAAAIVLGAWLGGPTHSFWVGEAQAQASPGGSTSASGANVRETRHNLSPSAKDRKTTSQNTSTTEAIVTAAAGQTTEICVYCHTPHGGSVVVDQPLWNRSLPGASTTTTTYAVSYIPYSSASLQASDLDAAAVNTGLGSPSKLCLSCHDGTISIGQVANAPGPGVGSTITMNNTASGAMPFGRNQPNANHGFTRRLGTDLRNDHPISFTYNATLATADGELRDPTETAGDGRPYSANRVLGSAKPYFPLTDNKVQCSTCHDPHRNTQKFLVKNRLVGGDTGPSAQTSYTTWAFNDKDQICLGCHTRLGKAWAQSVHSDHLIADETYKAGDAAVRDFPTTPTATPVWSAGCMNCHDTHTVAGSRRLLREGVGGGTASLTAGGIGYAATIRQGNPGTGPLNTYSALENTCYQCHTTTGSAVISGAFTSTTQTASTNLVPDIATDFGRTIRMPIINADQGKSSTGNSTEVHEIQNADHGEGLVSGAIPASNNSALGYGASNTGNRHVECSDCHNPHRIIRGNIATGATTGGLTFDATRRTHTPAGGTGGALGNVASGALRGIWGIEPGTADYSGDWPKNPAYWTVVKGDPKAGTSVAKTEAYLTREYQLCFKCHSNYAYLANTVGTNTVSFFEPLKTDATRGGTPYDTNRMRNYTNVAAEFLSANANDALTGGDQGEFGESTVAAVEDGVGASLGAGLGGTARESAGSYPADTDPGSAMTDVTGTQNHRSWHPVVWPTGRTYDERRITSTTDPVAGTTGRNFRPPFAANVGTQTMHCSDCHGSNGGVEATASGSANSWTRNSGPNLSRTQGPHGSGANFLLKGSWDSSVTIGGNGSERTGICFNCHWPQSVGTGTSQDGQTNAVSGFNNPGTGSGGGHANMHSGAACMRCHVAVPHGWKNKAFLINLNCVGSEEGGTAGCNTLSGHTGLGGTNAYSNRPYYVDAYLRIAIWRQSGNWTAASCGVASGGDKAAGTDWMNDGGVCKP